MGSLYQRPFQCKVSGAKKTLVPTTSRLEISVGMTDVLVLAAPSNVVPHPPKSDMHVLNLIVNSKER